MRQLNPKKYSNSTIPAIFQAILNITLILLAVVLCFLLGKEIVYSIRFVVFNQGVEIHYHLLERFLIFFLYFEFISMIIKYFQGNYHFPLRYFVYIGITAMIRLIIVCHENPMNTFLYTLSILALVISYYIINSKRKTD
ncbi:phosphate-starvation-inducible protein PsiE [Bacillus smithii]|uniref:phosphate-starvation-inducible protein PsiE n=1 Tax=Bacillus smithii TaxID=1479 RepID=UPI003D242DC0